MMDYVASIPTGLKEFLESEEICSLAVALPEGQVHVAPLLFWCDVNTLQIYMCTSKQSEKMWWHREGKDSIQAAVACGLVKKLPYALQMRGVLEVFHPEDDTHATEEFVKRASWLNDPNDPGNAMLVFKPTWARYTDRKDDFPSYQIEL